MYDITAFELIFTRQIPDEMRFNTFAAHHFLYLLAVTLFITIIALWAKRSDSRRKEMILTCFTWGITGMYLLRFAVFMTLDAFVEPQTSLLDRLPIHICSLNSIVMPLGVFRRNKTLLNFMYAISLPGAAIAILMPAMSFYGFYYYMSWHIITYFLDHANMVLVPILAIVCGRFRPEPKRLLRVAAYFFPYAAVIFVANRILNENMLFLNWPDEGTIIAVFAQYLGNPGYIWSMAAMMVIIVSSLYLPWAIGARLRRKRESLTT